MIGPKIPAIVASVAFVLSFLTGIINQISFPVLLVRAFLMAACFAGIVVLVHYLVSQFLPELASGESGISTPGEESTGGLVNITIDDSDSLSDTGTKGDGMDELYSPEMMPDFFEKTSGTDTITGNASVPGETEFMHASPTSVQGTQSSAGGKPAQPVSPQKSPARGSVSGLDVLPDLDDFIPQVKPQETEDDDISFGGSTPESAFSPSFREPAKNSGGAETELMTKAIRTILSRDNT